MVSSELLKRLEEFRDREDTDSECELMIAFLLNEKVYPRVVAKDFLDDCSKYWPNLSPRQVTTLRSVFQGNLNYFTAKSKHRKSKVKPLSNEEVFQD
mgnify:CR=1 FL=1